MKTPTLSFFIIVYLLGSIGLIFMHEQVHVAIYKNYGIESHVEYFSHFPDAVTIAEEPCPIAVCNFANDLNEIIQYPLMVLYTVVGMYLVIRVKFEEERQ